MSTALVARPSATTATGQPRPSKLPGLALSSALGLAAWLTHALVPGVPTTLVAVVLGATLAGSGALDGARDAATAPGLHVASRRVLRLGVALLGLQLALTQVLALGWPVLAVVLLVVTGGIAGTLALGRLLGLRGELLVLVAAGFSICGAAAGVASFASAASACASASAASRCLRSAPARAVAAWIFLTSSARCEASLPVSLSGSNLDRDLVADFTSSIADPSGFVAVFNVLFKLDDISRMPVSSAASFIALLNSRAIPLALPTNWPTLRNSTGRSLGPTTISATTPTTNSSDHPISNMRAYTRSLSVFVSVTTTVSSLSSAVSLSPFFTSSSPSLMPFLKLVMPLPTSPIRLEILPRPNRTSTTTAISKRPGRPILFNIVSTP